MVQIDDVLISLDIFEKYFLCEISACKGACCVEGESGAPLTQEEAQLIERYYPVFKEYISETFQDEVARQGFSVIDSDGDLVTPILNGRECLYTFVDERGVVKCAIERAYLEGKIDFRKPVSCHLFPIRIDEYAEYHAMNYQKLDICKPGRVCGSKEKLPLYKFLKEPLIRKYGEAWYHELETAAEELKKMGGVF